MGVAAARFRRGRGCGQAPSVRPPAREGGREGGGASKQWSSSVLLHRNSSTTTTSSSASHEEAGRGGLGWACWPAPPSCSPAVSKVSVMSIHRREGGGQPARPLARSLTRWPSLRRRRRRQQGRRQPGGLVRVVQQAAISNRRREEGSTTVVHNTSCLLSSSTTTPRLASDAVAMVSINQSISESPASWSTSWT